MSKEAKLIAYVVSDSIGQSAVSIARAALTKFPGLQYTIKDYTFITEYSEIDKIIRELKNEDETTVIFHTFANQDMAQYLESEAQGVCDECYDILTPIVDRVGEVTGLKSNASNQEPQPKLD
ncbi:MAG TPA: kinase/pyrophosphorylase, partial [Atopostipes sp.]|nr:kinase/pyrophosphorylase [Atopostipes sp.]